MPVIVTIEIIRHTTEKKTAFVLKENMSKLSIIKPEGKRAVEISSSLCDIGEANSLLEVAEEVVSMLRLKMTYKEIYRDLQASAKHGLIWYKVLGIQTIE